MEKLCPFQCQVLIYPVTTVFGFSLPSYREYFSECAGSALLNPFSMARLPAILTRRLFGKGGLNTQNTAYR